MNDELREKLSAYLDGALSELDRKDVEERIARDEETRLELEALRAVSGAVKGLPREPLPSGFLARLQSRRARDGAPARDWVFLPPAYRPVAAAMSMAVVALVVWDRAHGPSELESTRTAWDTATDRAAVKTAAQMPTSMDVSGRVAALNAPMRANETSEPSADDSFAKKEDVAGTAAVAPAGKRAAAPGKPLGIEEDDEKGGFGLSARGAGAGGGSAQPSAPASAFDKSMGSATNSYLARSEEERSAINERLYKNLEDEKKSMGIVRIVEKDSDDRPSRDRSDVMTLQASPEAPSLSGAAAPRQIASVRGAKKMGKLSGAKAKEALVPVKAIALKSAEALSAAWGAAGLPGEPPAVDFPGDMAVFLAGPNGCGITAVQNRAKFIVVLYKDSGFGDPSARVRAVKSSPKPVVVKLAE